MADELTVDPIWEERSFGNMFDWWFRKSMFIPSYIGEVRLRPQNPCKHNWFDCYNEV